MRNSHPERPPGGVWEPAGSRAAATTRRRREDAGPRPALGARVGRGPRLRRRKPGRLWVLLTPLIHLILKTPCLPNTPSHSRPGPSQFGLGRDVPRPRQLIPEAPGDPPGTLLAGQRHPGESHAASLPISFSHGTRFQGGQDQVPQSEGLATGRLVSAWGTGVQGEGVAGLVPEAEGGCTRAPSSAADAVFWVPSPPSLCVSSFAFVTGRLSCWVTAPPKPIGLHSLCKHPVSKQGHMLRSWGSRLPHTFRGDTIQPVTLINSKQVSSGISAPLILGMEFRSDRKPSACPRHREGGRTEPRRLAVLGEMHPVTQAPSQVSAHVPLPRKHRPFSQTHSTSSAPSFTLHARHPG